MVFIRKNKNRSGSYSIQIVSKHRGIYKVIKTLGSGRSAQEIEFLYQRARQEVRMLEGSSSLFVDKDDVQIESFISSLSNDSVQVIGPELIFGKIYDSIGFNKIESDLFRHLVITRLFHPGSKLKAIDYLFRFLNVDLQVDEIYRFMDKLSGQLKEQVEQIAFEHTKSVLGGEISIVFYDLTTLHFEASDEDDLRRTGFSKVGRHKDPQIYLGLLVGLDGFAIGYDVFEGNIYEGHTLLPTIQKFEERYNLNKPVIIADAGLLNRDNISMLEANGYQYILGARIKNETQKVKDRILEEQWQDGHSISIKKGKQQRIIVAYSDKRAAKDSHNRERGLNRLEKSLKRGRLTKANINNRGYNKYLKLIGDIQVEIDYDKYNADQRWDGLKGYITNTSLRAKQIIDNYNNLWLIEKAFRISKTDLKIRPIYHRLRHRIEGHICISFTAYSIYKELERVLKTENSYLSVKRAAELTHNMYQLNFTLPESKHTKSILLKMSREQADLYQIILKYY
ncbi:MAG TPA: IS1634 family transposase [Salinimicrobium catena]|uniref:IS1634 family transposase n=1 Tax=Salinimicrobium catena TaxID=390640 RepID=A0A7C2R5Y7_9FLAO|nr:IS1634 family transposase [Salinimicrobium catena]